MEYANALSIAVTHQLKFFKSRCSAILQNVSIDLRLKLSCIVEHFQLIMCKEARGYDSMLYLLMRE